MADCTNNKDSLHGALKIRFSLKYVGAIGHS